MKINYNCVIVLLYLLIICHYQYSHSPYEVLIGDNENFDALTSVNDTMIKVSYLRRLKYEQIIAEPSVRNFSPESRRCRFIDETNDDFFKVINLSQTFLCTLIC